MKLSPSIEALIDGLRHLPGVGPKSAQRMTLHLLERDREGAQTIADAIADALSKVKNCQQCRNLPSWMCAKFVSTQNAIPRHFVWWRRRGCDGD